MKWLVLALLLAGCAQKEAYDYKSAPHDGPDTKQTFDAQGNPNFGPKK